MSIFLNENSKVIVQGMTGSEGRKHTQRMLASGTAIVGGVNPSKAGQNVDFAARLEVFARAKAIESREQVGFGEALKRAIEVSFAQLSDRRAADTAHFLGAPFFGAQAALQRRIASLVGRQGVTFAEVAGTKASYTLKGHELYVRAVVSSEQHPKNPSYKGHEHQQAWTQPVGWEGRLAREAAPAPAEHH